VTSPASAAAAAGRGGLRTVRLEGFRNLADAVLALPPEGVALVGANAQGKSNFLEALHYLEIFRSCRGARDVNLIRFDHSHFRLEGKLGTPAPAADPSAAHTVAAAVQREGPVKKVTVDGVEPPRLGDALGQVGSVLFTPDDVRLVADGPQERRRFLDIVLSVNVPGYLASLQRFRQVLNQRNAALRERAPRSAVEAWNGMLATSGGAVMAARDRWVREGRSTFAAVVEELSGGERAFLDHVPALGGEKVEAGIEAGDEDAAWARALARALDATADGERRRGVTLVGPHRDELRLRGEPVSDPGGRTRPLDLREYGSGGQKRTAALALRILEAETVLRRRGHPALLLLDDVFAELDAARSERVLGLLDRTAAGQVVMTAPKDADVRFRRDRLPRWRIEAGRITTGGDA
jgi:DNA replication and repair protein RecF